MPVLVSFVESEGRQDASKNANEMLVGTDGIEAVAKSVGSMGLPNFGGVMFWDVSRSLLPTTLYEPHANTDCVKGSEGRANLENGKSIIEYAKTGLMDAGPVRMRSRAMRRYVEV